MVAAASKAGINRRGLTAFVREVVLPASPDVKPRLKRSAMKFRLRYGDSPVHRWGIFAAEDIPARRRVIEYTGERISGKEVVRRSVRPQVYHFWVTKKWALDGAVGGSGAQFINHSCEPNLVARTRKGHIWLVSLRPIAKGEELFFDYRLSGGVLQECRCGSANCRGYMNYFARKP
jgi:SET domain-containing protein